MRFLRLKVNRMSMRKIKDWLIRKLGGRPASITVDGTTYFQVHHVRMPVTIVAEDAMSVRDYTISDKILASKIAEKIVTERLGRIDSREDHGMLTRRMVVEILPPIEGR